MSKSLTIACTLLTATLLPLLAPTAAQAEVVDIRIDLGPSSDDTSGNWNNINGATATPLDLVNHGDGLDSGVDAELAVVSISTSGKGQGGLAWPDPCDWDEESATGDYCFLAPGAADSMLLTFRSPVGSGLDPSKTYKVEVIASSYYSGGVVGDYMVNDKDSTNVDGSGNPVSEGFDAYADGYNADPHIMMTWTGVKAALNESEDYYEIKLFVKRTGNYTALNAVNLTIPEPATMGLLGLGFAGMAVLRRRRRRA